MKDRIKYYLLDWRDENLAKFHEIFGEGRGLNDLTEKESAQLFSIAVASDGVSADVSASALKSAYDVCYTMKSHCGNAMAGADEGDEGYDADKEMYEKAKEFIDAYEAHLRLTM